MYSYKTSGTCSRQIDVELDGDIIKSVKFHGGCNGNLNGISKIVVGKTIDEVAESFEGTKCGFKSTSCPDQLVKALREAKENA
ncbi:MAG: TIGR03905 family TSCPD domain-containing protein [Oscillospiraceae bacterium]